MAHKHSTILLALVMAAVLLLSGCTAASAQEAMPTAAPTPEPIEAGFSEEEGSADVSASYEAGSNTVVTVSSVDELLEAIAPDTTVYLRPGTYDLSAAGEYGKSYDDGWYSWGEVHDGYELVIRSVENLTIIGTSASEVTISAVPRYANVMVFEDCVNVTVENITAGHTVEPGVCMGGVLYLDGTEGFAVRGSALYGCGILGVQAINSSRLLVEETAIYECSYGAVQTKACRDVRIVNCSVYDCEGYGLFQFWNTYGAAVVNSEIYENNCAALLHTDYSEEVYLLGTSVRDNVFYKSLIAAETESPVVEGCEFLNNSSAALYGGSVYGDGDVCAYAVSPEGGVLTEEDLEAMVLQEIDYNGPAAVDQVALDVTVAADGSRIVSVSTVDELLAAIGPDTTIHLSAGEYNLSQASGYGSTSGDYYVWNNPYDGPELVIKDVQNFHIIGEGADSTSILATPRYADVLSFEDCENVSLMGLTAGHTQEPSVCSGGVLWFENTEDILVSHCGLFGCGILGVQAVDCADIQVVSTEIYDCTYGAADLNGCANVVFEDCDIHDCGGDNAIRVNDSANVVCNGDVLAS